MKRMLLSLSLCALAGGMAEAATVSGTVTSTTTCAAVASQKVYLQDTIGNKVDSAVTSSTGAYTMTFPSGWVTPKHYLVTASACGSVWQSPGLYTGSNATVNPIICGSGKTLNGTVMLGSSPNTGPARVYLVRVQRNSPMAGDTTLTAVDSITLTNGPNFSFKRACAPTDTFLIKAALLPAHSAYANWLPSYDSSLNWSTATRYYASSWNGNPHYLFMFPGTNPGGPGFIGGSVLVGANKSTAVGDPLAARLMLLINSATNAPVAYTYSDAAGKFSFANVPLGTYKLTGDAWGMNNIPLTVVIAAGKTSVNNIIFEEHYIENSFRGRFNTTRVGHVSAALADVSIYPNPASKQVSLKGLDLIRGSKTVTIHNLIGAAVMSKEFSDGQAVTLSVDELPAGSYILQLSTEAGAASFKMIK